MVGVIAERLHWLKGMGKRVTACCYIWFTGTKACRVFASPCASVHRLNKQVEYSHESAGPVISGLHFK